MGEVWGLRMAETVFENRLTWMLQREQLQRRVDLHWKAHACRNRGSQTQQKETGVAKKLCCVGKKSSRAVFQGCSKHQHRSRASNLGAGKACQSTSGFRSAVECWARLQSAIPKASSGTKQKSQQFGTVTSGHYRVVSRKELGLQEPRYLQIEGKIAMIRQLKFKNVLRLFCVLEYQLEVSVVKFRRKFDISPSSNL